MKTLVEKFCTFWRDSKYSQQFAVYAVLSALASAISVAVLNSSGREMRPALHILYFFFLGMVFLLVMNPFSFFYKITVSSTRGTKLSALFAIVLVSAACTAPMGLNRIWNGEQPDHRNQYEELADALLEGHLDVHTDEDTTALSSMPNPYDMSARDGAGITYQWDHAFYKGHYYVYFGIIPAIVLFIPYKLITGHPLTTWKATAVFSVFVIIGIFLLGYKLIKKWKATVPLAVYLTLSSCLSLVVLWYAVKYPAMYCTAITAGVCFALWSIYFILDALFFDTSPKIWKIAVGAICGAFVFGCRPPIGLAEIVLVPVIIHHLKKKSADGAGDKKRLVFEAAAFILPYLITGVLLMVYNYARFENFFEFGQSYQLTVADQTSYAGGIADRLSFSDWMNWCGNTLFKFSDFSGEFPRAAEDLGALVMYPILFMGFTSWKLKENTFLKAFHVLLLAGVGIILEAQSLSSPFTTTRYHMDFVFLLCLAVLFKVVCEYGGGMKGNRSRKGKRKEKGLKRYSLFVSYVSLCTMAMAFSQFFTPGGASLAEVDPDLTASITRFFFP